jgi:hypothetical protein
MPTLTAASTKGFLIFSLTRSYLFAFVYTLLRAEGEEPPCVVPSRRGKRRLLRLEIGSLHIFMDDEIEIKYKKDSYAQPCIRCHSCVLG